jgi:hypothetical protein
VPRNRLRFGERAFAVDRLEGFADACSEIRHVTLSASDIDDRPVWAALVKVVMRLWSSGKGCRKSLSSPPVALELEACVCVGGLLPCPPGGGGGGALAMAWPLRRQLNHKQ